MRFFQARRQTRQAEVVDDPTDSFAVEEARPAAAPEPLRAYQPPQAEPEPEDAAEPAEAHVARPVADDEGNAPAGSHDADEEPAGQDRAELRDGYSRTPRMADFMAFRKLNEDLEQQLQAVAERVTVTRRLCASLKPYLEQTETDIRVTDEVYRDRNALSDSLTVTRRNLDRLTKELARAEGDLVLANGRIAELRNELEQRRAAAQEAEAQSDRLRAELAKASSDIGYLHSDLARLNALNEHHAAARANSEQARAELEAKLARLQQMEASARNKAIELNAQNERLSSQLPMLIAEHEKLQNLVRAFDRERAELENRIKTAHDRVEQLERENQERGSQLASEAYALRTELDMSHSAYRTLERARAESDAQVVELQAKLRESDAWRDAANNQIRWLEMELEAARRESSASLNKLSDLNLKYMNDLMSLDHHREQNRELQKKIEALSAENHRLVRFEALYKAGEAAAAVEGRPREIAGNAFETVVDRGPAQSAAAAPERAGTDDDSGSKSI